MICDVCKRDVEATHRVALNGRIVQHVACFSAAIEQAFSPARRASFELELGPGIEPRSAYEMGRETAKHVVKRARKGKRRRK